MTANSQVLESLGLPQMKSTVIASKAIGKFVIQRRHLIFSSFVFIFLFYVVIQGHQSRDVYYCILDYNIKPVSPASRLGVAYAS